MHVMAVRYRVENLIRRGNIFYWRPRIPSRFEACPPGSRLALSLQVSDYARAEIIARRLNTLLAKLKFGPMSRTVTRENLQRLCAAERDEELDRQDDYVFVSRRHGRVNQIQDVEMDLENAWAYRLIEMFGAHVSLTLAEGCPGRSYLRANGIPDAHQANIFHNYSQLRAEFLSRYGANVLARKMAAFDIEDTAINREKTLQHVARGRADALMAVDERYPFADKSLSALTGGTAPGFARAPVAEEASTPLSRSPAPAECEQGKEAPAAAVPTADVPIPPRRPDAAPEAIVLGTLLPAGPTGETSQSALPILVVREAANKGKPLPIAEFMDIFEKLVANKKQDWTEESARHCFIVATGFLWPQRGSYIILALWVTCFGAVSTTTISKLLVGRHRPEIMLDVNATGWSFPSGHATAAMAVYGFIAYAIARAMPGFRERFEVIYCATVLITLIGFSRMFLGVHYLTDILGGFLVGGFWLLIGFSITEGNRPQLLSEPLADGDK